MSFASNRPVAELPGDPSRLHFSYSHGHPAQSWDFEDTLECWHVQITYGLSVDEEWDDEPSESGNENSASVVAAPAPGSKIGEVLLYRLRAYTGQNRWEAADAHSGDLEVIASAVLAEDGHDYNAAFDETIQSFGDLLILDRVHLSKAWRGFGLGPYCAAEAIRRLSGGCSAVATYPGMSEYPDNRDEVTETYREDAKKKIAALWESIGFHCFQRGVWLLDTALKEPEELLGERRAALQALSDAYQARPAPQSGTAPEPLSSAAQQPAPVTARPQDTSAPADGLSAAASILDLREDCTRSGWSANDRATALAAAEQVTSDTDLRKFAATIKDVHFGLHKAWTDAVTFPARSFSIRPFLDDPTALGPLADVWVYGSNLTGRYQGRSHVVGGVCHHARPLSKYTERMTLEELVRLSSFWEWNGPACSFCGGWSGQRLTHPQHEHYLSVAAECRR